MKIIFENKYIRYYFDKNKTLLYGVFIYEGDYIEEDDVKNTISNIARKIIEYKPLYILGDNSKRKVPFHPEIRSWVAKTMGKACLEAKVQKYAIILPLEAIASLSTVQVEEEAREYIHSLDFKYFYNKEKALNWFGFDSLH